jgi:hypothetical protein
MHRVGHVQQSSNASAFNVPACMPDEARQLPETA